MEAQVVKKKSYLAEYWAYNKKEAKKNRVLYLFTLPYFVLFTTFLVAPVLIAIYLGFTYFNIIEPPQYIGWQNYIAMMTADDIFIIALKNTLLFALITGPVGYLLCLGFAWMVNELTPKVRAFMTLIFYAPVLANVWIIWKIIFASDQYGLINGFLIRWGFITAPIQWFENTNYMPSIVILVLLWSSLGTGFLTLIAGLQNVDRSLYEAAAVDGISNRWQELWYVTLPYIRPHLLLAAILSITSSFGIGGQITALIGYPSQDYILQTIILHVEDFATTRFEMGYACAMATLLFILMVGSNKLAQKFLMKVGR